jgi:enamine deaminase RidA (YjgF/YER057c/UK114 family)
MSPDRDRSVPKPLAHYAVGKWSGDTLFLAGVVAVDPATGRVVRGYEDLEPDVARSLATGQLSVDAKEGPIAAQAWFILDQIRRTLEGEGLTLRHVVKLTQYLTDLRDFPVYNRIRVTFFPEDPPASTVVQVAGLLPTEESRLEVDCVATRNPTPEQE